MVKLYMYTTNRITVLEQPLHSSLSEEVAGLYYTVWFILSFILDLEGETSSDGDLPFYRLLLYLGFVLNIVPFVVNLIALLYYLANRGND